MLSSFLIILKSFCILLPVIEINSDTSVAEAVQLMAQHKILSVPVVDVEAPEDATWIDRYIGIIEFAGIVVWILHQVHKPILITENRLFHVRKKERRYFFLSSNLDKRFPLYIYVFLSQKGTAFTGVECKHTESVGLLTNTNT